MQTYNNKISTGVVMNTTITSSPRQLKNMFGYCIQAVVTGTPTGTFKLQASSDPEELMTPTYPINWTDIDGSSQAISAAGNILWNVSDVSYNWVRFIYTDGSSGASTAVLNVTFNGKGV